MKALGYTTLQLVVVIAIMGILGATTLVRFPSYTSIQTEGLASVFSSDLRLTALLAISENDCYYITIGNSSYTIFNSSGVAITPAETGTNPYTFPAGAITPTGTIAFNGMGQPFTNTSCTPVQTVAIAYTVNSGSSPPPRTITISPYTGYIQ